MFGAVGALGLVVHLAMLDLLLNGVGIAFRPAQATAVALTIAFNFVLNNSFTYRDRRLRGWAANPRPGELLFGLRDRRGRQCRPSAT